ncbi:hypothetical protein CWN75_17495, partial [Klebsiella pneumoniae]
IRATVWYPVASPGKRSATGGEFNDSLSPIGNTAATLRAVIRTLAAEFASALSGLRSGIRLLAPVSAARPGDDAGEAALIPPFFPVSMPLVDLCYISAD